MKIPIRNLYWVLCYAWDVLDQSDLVDVGSIDSPNVQDLLANLLVTGVRRAARRGLDREYIEFSEETSRLRGRIDVSGTLVRQLEVHSKASVIYDDLSSDVPINQVLKAGIHALHKHGNLEQKSRDDLAATYHSLRDISDRRLSPSLFRQVKLHRNNRSYKFLLEICRLIQDHLIADDKGREMMFQGFLEDEKQLRTLFEKFVRNFFEREQNLYRVRSEQIRWQDTQEVEANIYLPEMRTDITLSTANRVFIVDTKYTPKAISEYRGSRTVVTGHLYQLWAYISNFSVREGAARKVDGLLLYPTVYEAFHGAWNIQGHRIEVATINLNQPWGAIRSDLLSFLAEPLPACHGERGLEVY